MKTTKPPMGFSVYCWDGCQRGHIGDFGRLKEAKDAAADACEKGIHGEEFFIIRNSDRKQTALFLPDYGGEVSVKETKQ